MVTLLELLYIKKLHKDKDDIKTLASKIGINQSMLYDIEAGRRNLTKDIFNKIIKYYNVTYNDRQSIYDEAYKLTLELFSYIISFEKPDAWIWKPSTAPSFIATLSTSSREHLGTVVACSVRKRTHVWKTDNNRWRKQ